MINPFFDLWANNLRFLIESTKLTFPEPHPWATANRIALDLPTVLLRDFTDPVAEDNRRPWLRSSDWTEIKPIPVLIDAPFAGHPSSICDYADGQSLVQTFLSNGHPHVFATDWRGATQATKDHGIDDYLADMLTMVDDLGGKVHLVGLCQGGWLSAMFASLYPEKVATLVMAGTPIDTSVGDGPVQKLAKETSLDQFRGLVEFGNGVLKGSLMLLAWKGMHPEQHYIKQYFDLYGQIQDDKADAIASSYLFSRWYNNPIDLPGMNFYYRIVDELFKQNLLYKGQFIGLGRVCDLSQITCPVYLLAGEKDDITPKEQMFNAINVLTGSAGIGTALCPGGHIGLFMGRNTLRNFWPAIAQWCVKAVAPTPCPIPPEGWSCSRGAGHGGLGGPCAASPVSV